MPFSFDLAPLERALAADLERLRAARDTGRLWARLSSSSWRTASRLVRHLARHQPGTYGAYAHEDELIDALADIYEDEGPEAFTDVATLAEALRRVAERRWLIATPLVNVLPPSGVIRLAEDVALVPTWHRQARIEEAADPVFPALHLRRQFGTDVNVGARIDHDLEDEPFDTRHTVSLVTSELGTRRLAQDRAHAVARLCVAGWTLLSPPEHEMHMPIWPSATEWLPGPHLHREQRVREIDPHAPRAPRERGSSLGYEPDADALYRLPDDWRLQAPVEAVAVAGSSAWAASLLSASWSLYLAGRVANDLLWLDRLVLVMQAREALCEPPPGSGQSVDDRWLLAIRHAGVFASLRKLGFTQADLTAVRTRARHLRNIGVHGADSALLALGFPPDRRRTLRGGAHIEGEELAPAFVREGTAPAFHAVRFLACHLYEHGVSTGFDEEQYERLFA